MELQEFIRNFMKQRSSDYYQKFWAKTSINEGLTIKTFDGKVLMVKPDEIWCEDLGDVSGVCMCGHPIRYQYWLAKVGPIGSSCIQTITGLDGQDLRYILQGGLAARKEVEELKSLIEKFVTLENQLQKDNILCERVNFVKDIKQLPSQVQPFIENNIPLPTSIRNLIYKIYNQHNKMNQIKNKFGPDVAECVSTYDIVATDLERILSDLKIQMPEKAIHFTIRDIGRKIVSGYFVSPKAIDFFVKLVRRASDPKFIDALNILVILNQNLLKMENFWANMIKENLDKALQYGLSDAQINYILNKSSTGKDGLAIRFKELLQKEMIKTEEPQPLPEYKSVKTIEPTVEKITAVKEQEEKILDFDPGMPMDP